MGEDLMKPIMLTSGAIYSSAKRVNVIMPTADNSAGNNHYLPNQRGKTLDYLRECVRTTLYNNRGKLIRTYPNYVIYVRSTGNRGEYSYTVWSE